MAHKTSNLTRLPLELRDTIYEYVIGDITTLVLPKSTYNSSTTQSLQKKLPPCLFLNHQILLEATNAFIHRATLTVRRKIPEPDASDLHSQTTALLQLFSICTLDRPPLPATPAPHHPLLLQSISQRQFIFRRDRRSL
jgi:hypothetical protein